MTKPALAVCALLVAALLAPGAASHGAAGAREVDTRVLLDEDGALGFAGCTEAGCAPGLDSGALDLLALDLREFRDANGTALLAFRTTVQAEAAQQAGRSIFLSFTLGGQPKALTLKGDGLAYASSDVDRVFVSADTIGDGHAKAIEAWVALDRLGAKPGDVLSDLQATSFAGDKRGDLMPGTWFPAGEQDQPVPFVPDEPPSGPGDLMGGEAGTYTIAGPAALLNVSADRQALDTGHAAARLTLTLTNPLATLAQFVTVRASGLGLSAESEPAAVNLDAGASKTVTLTVRGPASTLNVTVSSDLGGYASLAFPVTSAHAAGNTTTAAPTTGPSESPTKKSPALPLGLLALGLAALAVARRRW
jgi:MYXO-CTERM domain-containing protein